MNIALIGLGYWGKNYKRLLENNNFSFSLKYLVDEKINVEDSRYQHFKSIDALLKEANDLDCAIISTPTSTHYSIAKKLLSNNIHTLVEKPITTNLSEARELVDISEQNNVILLTDYIFLYSEAVKKIVALVKEGTLGDIIHISFERVNLGPIRSDVSSLWDLSTHDISILQAINESLPKKITSSGFSRMNEEIEDMVNISLNYENMFVTLFSSWLHPEKSRTIKIVGTQKMIIFDDMSPSEPIKIFDKKIGDITDKNSTNNGSVFSFSVGDINIPFIDQSEPLFEVVKDFDDKINGKKGNTLNTTQLSLNTIEILNKIENCL